VPLAAPQCSRMQRNGHGQSGTLAPPGKPLPKCPLPRGCRLVYALFTHTPNVDQYPGAI
jgi:hypothetical protein